MMQYYPTFHSNDAQDMTLEQVTNIIRTDEALRRSTLAYRDLTAQGHDEAASQVKQKTPQVAVSFRMEGGRSKDCCRECQHLVLIDFDAKGPDQSLSDQELERVVTLMRTSYHALLAYRSISGRGYHVVVPYVLPEGVAIDMAADPRRAEDIYTRAYMAIARQYSVWCGHEMDLECRNVNRMTGLSHDPEAVCRPDARPIRLTREELGIDREGRLIRMKTPKRAQQSDGSPAALPLGDRLQQAVAMVEQEAGITFAPGQRHNFVMRVAFILNRMGVSEDEAASGADAQWLGHMDGRPSDVVHSCYRTAASEFGVWMPQASSTAVKTEVVKAFLRKKTLQYDVLTQKTRQRLADGTWQEMKERQENDLFMECCAETGVNLTERLFLTVLNSSTVPEVNPLRQYIGALPRWEPGQPDYIAQVAQMVHMATPEEQALWQQCFPKWFVAMVAGWTSDQVVNHQVIVLVGRQGIYKSTWINRLLPPALQPYLTDNIDTERLDKDEQLRAAEYGLINIDELDKLNDRQLNRLKQMITTQHVDVRAPFGRHKEKRVRVATYAASGNKQEFLTDQTGNRRWLPFHVDAIDSPYQHPMPYDGMYAQARHLLESGFNYWFDLDEISTLQQHVDAFMVPTSEEELIPVYFSPAQEGDAGATFLTGPEIWAKISVFGNLKRSIEPRQMGNIMKRLGYKSERRGHENRTGYWVREHLQSEIDKIRHPDIF
ncbi:MAG: hypothetical protein IJ588_11425 [Prevotella sp.]|nr:hypothetical protein [Prevotella sp.]